MKKFFAAVCCVLLVSGSVVAQEEAATPVADAVATAAEAVVQDAAPVADAPVVGSVTEVPMATNVVAGSPVMNSVPMMTSVPMVQTQGCCGGGVAAPFSAPVMQGTVMNSVMGAPAANSGCSTCGNNAVVNNGCSTCAPRTRTRRYVVRSAVGGFRSRVGSRRSSSCCN